LLVSRLRELFVADGTSCVKEQCQADVRNPAHTVILVVQDQAVSRRIGNPAGWQKPAALEEDADREKPPEA
jgi:hypothetical protein